MKEGKFESVMADELRRIADLIESGEIQPSHPPSMRFNYDSERPIDMEIEFMDPDMGIRTVEIY